VPQSTKAEEDYSDERIHPGELDLKDDMAILRRMSPFGRIVSFRCAAEFGRYRGIADDAVLDARRHAQAVTA
jgi:hypothetical protein